MADIQLGDTGLADALTAAETSLAELRDTLNTDPLALWQHGQTDTGRLDRLRERVKAAAVRAAELARLRDGAGRRIAALTAAISAATAARQDAAAAQDRAAARIADPGTQPLPDLVRLTKVVAAATDLQAAGRWTRLATELDAAEKDIAAATERCRAAERAAAAQVDRRDELRGLLDAYKAKAAGLGGAENAELEAAYGQARDVLWTAPCDLAVAAAAVTAYQQAVLAFAKQGGGRSDCDRYGGEPDRDSLHPAGLYRHHRGRILQRLRHGRRAGHGRGTGISAGLGARRHVGWQRDLRWQRHVGWQRADRQPAHQVGNHPVG